ncbi:MAG: T9SS type A sorting domain-containing protein [Fulvivirga sp.]
MKRVFTFLGFILVSFGYAQTGPGGVGTGDGSSGPRNVLWLRSDIGITQSGTVSAWADQSGNGLNAVQATGGLQPAYTASNANLNGLPSISFGPTGTTNFHLAIPDNDLLDASPGMSFFVVLRTSGASGLHAFLNKRTGFTANQSYRFFRNSGNFISDISDGTSASVAAANNTNYILSSVYDQSVIGDQYTFYSNSTTENSAGVPTTLPNEASPLYIGNFNLGDNRSFPGDIAEVIIYQDALNGGEKVIVENYLSEKYGIAIGSNDFFSLGDASYTNDLVGIGTADGTNKSSDSGFSDALQIQELSSSLNSTNEFLFLAHDNTAHASNNTSDLGEVEITDRWARSWFVESTGSVATSLRFDFGIAGLGTPSAAGDYVLLYRANTSSNFTRVAANSYTIENTDQVVVDLSNIDLATGYYTIGRGTQLTTTTYYSFQTGLWEDALTWTTDPSGNLRVPASGNIPTSGDNLVILSGRTVTMATDDNDGVNLTVNGQLNIADTRDHNFFSIAGNGVISIEGDDDVPTNVVDNFPTGSNSDFADPVVGGTLLIEGGGLNLNTARTYNDVVIDLTSTTNVSTLLADYTINGDLTIQSGIFQINDNTSTTSLNINVFGDVQVDANGEINTGSANARHQFNFYGNLVNNGTAEFTNRVAADNNNEATDGIVDANFLNSVADQSIDCNGVTNFYRIEIDKGADETYILDINSLSAANFNLFGPVNYSTNSAQLDENDNALGLIRGTVRLNTNVDVPFLNNTGVYSIFESARVWVNGGSTTKTGGGAIVPYGIVQVSDGTLDAPVTSGLTIRDNGSIVVQGGVVTVNQIRTSIAGATNIGSYNQSGGTVNITGSTVFDDYYTFSLTYPGNTFTMSGGILNVSGSVAFQDNTGTSGQIHGGGIFIDSDPGNISVTGGTVIMENNTNVNFKVTSRAPFWNVIMRSSGGTATEVDLDAGTSGDTDPGEFETISTPELLVLNDLTIEDGVTFDHNGFDVEIGSDFTIQTTGEYLYDAAKQNTTTINGVDNATLSLLNRVVADAGDEQLFWNLVIDKPTDRTVSLASAKPSVTGNDNNLINIQGDAFKVLSGTLDQGLHSIRVNTDTLLNYDVLTVYDPANATPASNPNSDNDLLKLRPDDFVLITADTSQFGNVRLNNGSRIVTLVSDIKIDRLEYRHGRIDLGDNNLKIDALRLNLSGGQADWNGCGGCNSVEDMFITDGLSSAGGLSLYIPADGLDPSDGDAIFDFPFGIGTDGLDAFVDTGSGTGNSKYTPAAVTVSGVTDDGYITIRPVDDILPTTEPTGGDLLSYYWRVDFEDFTTPPTVEYQFTYYDNDLDGSANESTFAAGKVLEQAPFTRSYEDDPVGDGSGAAEGVDDTGNTITFNGFTDTGFTLEETSYTAGETGRFVGAPEIYFSRADGNWNNTNTWSTVDHTSATNTGTFPQAGDVAIVSFNGADFHRVNAVGDLEVAILEFNSMPDATAKNISLSRVLFGTTEDLNAEIVRGIGELQFASNNGNGPSTINAGADLGDFVENIRSSFIYTLGGTGDITIPAIAQYPSLRFFAGGANPSVGKTERFFLDRDIECSNLLIDGNSILEVTNNIVVSDTLFLGANRDGELIFNNGTVANTVETDYLIFGADLFGANRAENVNRILVESGGGNGIEHRLVVNEDIIIATGSSGAFADAGADFDLFTNTSDNNVILELRGDGSNTFTIEGDDDIGSNGIQFIPEFYRIIMSKGTSVASSFAFNDGFTLQGSTSGATKALTLQNGLLQLNSDDNDINFDLSTGGGDFDIPSSAGLQLTQAQVNVSGDDTGIILDGQLIIDGGTLDMDDAVGNGNNFIEYSASGNAFLNISAGTLTVGSQIRPLTTAETGVLQYRQTGGDVRIGTQAAPENDRGMLQIYNTGSEFTYTGGTLAIERHQDAPAVAALFLDPDDSNITGSEITIFNANTPAGQNDFRINSVIDLENLTINGANSPSAEIDINVLTINGNLTIAAGATFNGNGRTLTVAGDFDNDGTYDAQSNETIFNATGTQQITGSGSNNFFRFTKSATGILDLTSTLDVADLFTINEGTLSDNGFSINLAADAVIDGTHTSSGGNGLVFSGGPNQELRRSSAGTGMLGTLTINNSNGVTIPDGNGYNFTIEDGLRLENGVFNVGGSVIALGVNALITPVNAFSVSNMIQTNSSFTDGGVSKTFPNGFSQDFTFPIGQSFYTPVSFDFTSGSNTSGTSIGTIGIFPADEFHPTVNDGADFFITGDINNVLQYYWTVTASGITGLTTDMTMGYDDSQVLSNEPGFDETDYIAARILTNDNPTDEINKFATTDVDESTNLITFNFSGVSDNGITGDYFAGLDDAIPDNVTTYTVDLDGNFGDDVYDFLVPGGGAPTGAIVIVPNGFTLTLDSDNANFYRTEIQSGGVLEVNNSTNHRLGQLSGTGNLRIISDGINANLPAFSGDFLSCTGGGLEYGGTGSYSVLSGITELRNLTISGTGTKSMANNNLIVCNDLVVDGPTFVGNLGNSIRVDNNFVINNGQYRHPSGSGGVLTVLNDLTVNGGSFRGGFSSGRVIIANDLNIQGGDFIVGAGSHRNFLRGDLTFSSGTFDGGSGSARFIFDGSAQQNLSGNFTGMDEFYNLEIDNSSGLNVASGGIEVFNTLSLTDGIITTNGNQMELLSTASISPAIGSSISYVVGRLDKVLGSSGTSFDFPVGSASRWRPASVNNISDGGLTWSAEYFEANPTSEVLVDNLNPTDPGQIATISDGEYWKIADDAGAVPPPGVTATVGLSWGTDSDVSAIFAEREELEVLIWNDGSSSWDDLDGTSFSASHTQSEGRFTAVSSNTFSEQIFTLGSASATNPLPIELQKFDGETIDGDNYLEWITASELNNDYFELQRSADGISYETIMRIEGQGTNTGRTTYQFTDTNPLGGFNYYRLKQVDIDGTVTVFNKSEWIVLLTITSDVEFSIKAYPNPTVQNNINLRLNADQNLPMVVQMLDVYGKVVFQNQYGPGEFTNDIKINPVQGLREGVYVILAEQNGLKLTRRVIITE